jgi:hypothetical protein
MVPDNPATIDFQTQPLILSGLPTLAIAHLI